MFFSYSKLRERHAKTLEIAQEEVLTCVGMIMYERLRRVYVSLREEERACQVLAAVGVHALCRNFDMSVEKKQGISNLELLYQEISRAEKAKEHKREQKKLKKKKKKNEKKNSHRICDHNADNFEAADDEEHHDGVANTDEEELHEHVTSNNGIANESEKVLDFEQRDAKVKISSAGQKDVDEDAGVECDHHEEIHDIAEEGNNNANVNNIHSRTQQLPATAQQQQKKKKQKQKQKVKTPQRKNATSSGNNVNSRKNDNVIKTNTTNTKKSAINNTLISSSVAVKCNDCNSPHVECPCESDVKDSGYGSEPLSNGNSRTSSVVSSPEDTSEGSEVSCSEGFCNHEHSGRSSLLADLDVEHHNHHYDDNSDPHNYDHSFEGFGFESCNFFQQHHMNILSLQQMLVSHYKEILHNAIYNRFKLVNQ